MGQSNNTNSDLFTVFCSQHKDTTTFIITVGYTLEKGIQNLKSSLSCAAGS